MPTQYETQVSRLALDEDEDTSSGVKTYTSRKEGQRSTSNKEKPTKKKSPKKLLSVRAAEVARQIKDDPIRIMGILGTGGSNRRWASAVAQALRKVGIGDGTMKGWEAQIVGSLEDKPQVGSLVVKKAVDLWALNNPDVYTEERVDLLVRH